jgi:hypothetical protein
VFQKRSTSENLTARSILLRCANVFVMKSEPFQVTENHPDQLALALDGAASPEDPVGEVFGCVGGEGISVPQLGQSISQAAPHFSQNFTPSRLSNWHFGHLLLILLEERRSQQSGTSRFSALTVRENSAMSFFGSASHSRISSSPSTDNPTVTLPPWRGSPGQALLRGSLF